MRYVGRRTTILALASATALLTSLMGSAIAVESAPEAPPSSESGTSVREVRGLIVAYEPGVAITDSTGQVTGSSSVDAALLPGRSIGAGMRTVELSEPVSEQTAEQLAADLAADPRVRWAVPDRFIPTPRPNESTSAGALEVMPPRDTATQQALPMGTPPVKDGTNQQVLSSVSGSVGAESTCQQSANEPIARCFPDSGWDAGKSTEAEIIWADGYVSKDATDTLVVDAVPWAPIPDGWLPRGDTDLQFCFDTAGTGASAICVQPVYAALAANQSTGVTISDLVGSQWVDRAGQCSGTVTRKEADHPAIAGTGNSWWQLSISASCLFGSANTNVRFVTYMLDQWTTGDFAPNDYKGNGMNFAVPGGTPVAGANDPYYTDGSMWGLYGAYGIKAPQAWTTTTGSSQVVVAVLDTGITTHADLSGRSVAGYDMISDALIANDGDGRDSDPSDPGDWITYDEDASEDSYFYGCWPSDSSWHGTHVAGTIAALTNNGSGVASVAPGVRLQHVRVLGKCGGLLSDIIAGITWASGGTVDGVPVVNATPARVINMSLGGLATCDEATQAAIDAAVGRGTTVVVSAGNSDADAKDFVPASCNNVITVAATDSAGQRAWFSNFGPGVDIAAPGVGVLSTLNSGSTVPVAQTYAYYAGTSMAAPHVTGVVALMLSRNANLTPAQIETRIKAPVNVTAFSGGTCDAETSKTCGAGIVNAEKLVAPGTLSSLASLSLSSGALNPAFSGATTSYTASVANSVSGLTVTPLATDTSSAVTVNETTVAAGSASGAIPLDVGQNTITVVVTAEDTSATTYTVTVTRAAPTSSGGGGSSSTSAAPASQPASPVTQTPVTPAEPPAGIRPVTFADPASVTAAMLAALSPEQFATIPPSVIALLPPAAFRGITPEQARAMTIAQVNAIRPAAAPYLQPLTVAAFSAEQLTAMRPATVARLTAPAIAGLSADQVAGLRPAAVTRMTERQVRSLRPSALAGMSAAQLRALTSAQVDVLTARQLAALSPAQRRALEQ